MLVVCAVCAYLLSKRKREFDVRQGCKRSKCPVILLLLLLISFVHSLCRIVQKNPNKMASNSILNRMKKFTNEERAEIKEKFADVSIFQFVVFLLIICVLQSL